MGEGDGGCEVGGIKVEVKKEESRAGGTTVGATTMRHFDFSRLDGMVMPKHLVRHMTTLPAVAVGAVAPSEAVAAATAENPAAWVVGVQITVAPLRSLLADLIQPNDVKELRSVLVDLSAEVSKTIAELNDSSEKHAEGEPEIPSPACSLDNIRSIKNSDAEKPAADDCSSSSQVRKGQTDSVSENDQPPTRPMSPGTLALMCDEVDAMLIAAVSRTGFWVNDCNSSSPAPAGQGFSKTYVDHERILLTALRDCPNKLITCGEIKVFIFGEKRAGTLQRLQGEWSCTEQSKWLGYKWPHKTRTLTGKATSGN